MIARPAPSPPRPRSSKRSSRRRRRRRQVWRTDAGRTNEEHETAGAAYVPLAYLRGMTRVRSPRAVLDAFQPQARAQVLQAAVNEIAGLRLRPPQDVGNLLCRHPPQMQPRGPPPVLGE